MFTIQCTEHMPDISGKVHYISWACESGLSCPFAYVQQHLKTDFRATMDIFHTINVKSETGTFYPLANITLLPVGDYSKEQITAQFNDALKAQNLYIHADTVIFDLRNSCYSYLDHEECFQMILHSYDMMQIFNKVHNKKIENWILLCLDRGGITELAEQYMRRAQL